jgi:hypothetical protein
MKAKGFINLYPASLPERGSNSKPIVVTNDLRTGNKIFLNREEADAKALPGRLTVAVFEYDLPCFKNVYKGAPYPYESSEITLGGGEYRSEEEAIAACPSDNPWCKYRIGVVKLY